MSVYISYEELRRTLQEILLRHGVSAENAAPAAENFAQSSLDGVYSHGVNRFPRLVDYLDRGLVDGTARPSCVVRFGCMERWDGHRGLGNVNARLAMERACTLASLHGIGLVAIANTSHWMRGGAFGRQAADHGYIGLCWTNTMPNTPPWGGAENRLGNNPFIIAIPQSEGRHIVLDMAMTQFAYGKIEAAAMRGETLPVPGGYDKSGALTDNAAQIAASQRPLTIGYWKGSGFSLVLDLAGALLTGGNTVADIAREAPDEVGLTQVLIAIDPSRLEPGVSGDESIAKALAYMKSAAPAAPGGSICYPGEHTLATRASNLRHGIPVEESVWQQISRL